MFGAPRENRRAAGHEIAFDEVVDLLGLTALLDRSPRNLSGGERQRVAIGRALLSQPKLLLMDEPLSALDRATKSEILPFLERLRDRLSLPIVYITHDIAEVERLADQIVLMEKGRVLACRSACGIAERSVAAFGHRPRCSGQSWTAMVETFDAAYGLADPRHSRRALDRACVAGARPASVAAFASSPATSRSRASGPARARS